MSVVVLQEYPKWNRCFCDFPVMFSRGQKRDFWITVGMGRRLGATDQPSGSGTQFLECGGFQTVEVAYAGRRLLKDMLRYFKRRDGLADHEASIRDNLIQRLPHDRDRRCIKFLFQIIPSFATQIVWVRLRVLL